MATKAVMQFKRGDAVTHYFLLPIASYAAGGTLSFSAKPIPDNDNSDLAAVIEKSFTDTNVDLTMNPGYATYIMQFVPADITGVSYNSGTSVLKFKGEFQWTPASGINPISFPGDNQYIEVDIFADIRRIVP